MSKIKRLPDAELEIMNALWDADAPLTAAELETALSIITTAYLRSEDLQTAVEENINYLNPPVQGVFRSFLTRIKHIDRM